MKHLSIFGLLTVFTVTLVISSKALSQESKEKKSALSLAVLIEVKPRLVAYLKVRQAQTKELASKYGKVIDARLNKAADAGDLKTAEAFQGEKESLNALGKAFVEELKDPVMAVREGVTLPDLDASAPEALVVLRKIWTTEWQKIRIKLDGELQQSLKKVEIDLTKARDLKNAKEVFTFRESLLSGSPVAAATAVDSKNIPSPTSAMAKGSSAAAAAATIEKPFVNSLKMKFVPVPITGGPSDGKRILFSVWETRVKDYEKFIKDDRNRESPKMLFNQKDDHPAVKMSWEDAVAFCKWLTDKERKKGDLGEAEHYRLPTDHEWSCAVGIGKDEVAEASPRAKNQKLDNVFPWGTKWPPPKGAGNFYGEETKRNPVGDPKWKPIEGYNDSFDRTSPAGSFEPNEYGLYDMGGNVWEWCEDSFSPTEQARRVVRGGSWYLNKRSNMLSSARISMASVAHDDRYGFRCVLDTGNRR